MSVAYGYPAFLRVQGGTNDEPRYNIVAVGLVFTHHEKFRSGAFKVPCSY